MPITQEEAATRWDKFQSHGGAAFPPADESSDGMSLRDYFAAAALQGILANPEAEHNVAAAAYYYADTMLKERMK